MRTILTRLVAVVLLCCHSLDAAQAGEYDVKAAFVLNFLRFVDWPAAKLPPSSPITVCVVGESPVTARLGLVSRENIRGHGVRVRTVASALDLPGCHVAYVPVSYGGRLVDLREPTRGSGVLLISEDSASASQAVIDLVLVGSRVAFDVNLDLAAQEGLTISSKLLRLARRVSGRPAMLQTEGGH